MSEITLNSTLVSAQLKSSVPQINRVGYISGSAAASARVLRLSDKAYFDDQIDISWTASSGGNFVSYLGNVSLHGRPAAQIVLRYLVQEDRLTITCEFREEYKGYQLMSVFVPLVSAAEDAALAIPTRGGRLVDVAACEPHQHTQRGTNQEMPLVAMIKQRNAAALLELASLDDNIVSAVAEDGSGKHAELAVRFTHRYGPQNPELPTFRVTNRSEAFLTMFEATGPHWWTTGARMLRNKVYTSIPPLYDGAVIYKIKCDQPDFDETQYITFDEAIDIVRKVHNYTAGGRQIVYLNGWQWYGHDTGYPDVFTVNERLGGLEKFKQALKSGEQYNAVISFHDNYDDAYTNSPAWEDDIIATDEHGKPKTGGVWGGGQAYIISPHKYIERARKRIQRTVEMYGVDKTIHVDVFSVVPDRYDFDPDNPAGFARSAEAKNYIARAFREQGLDMTSEGICSAFVGNINFGWHFPDSDGRVFPAEEQIPLLPFIYHGHIIGAGGINNDDRHLLKHLLWGLGFCMDVRKSTNLADCIEKYYLVYVPFFQLAHRTMQAYESANGTLTVHYDPGSFVRVNVESNEYEIVVDGTTVARNYTVTCPLPQGGWTIYSRTGGPMEMHLPVDTRNVEVSVLSENEPQPFSEFKIRDCKLKLQAVARTPYHVVSK